MKTSVTNEQIATARDAMKTIGEAAGVLQNLLMQLGWEDTEFAHDLEVIGADEFTQLFFCCVDGCSYPGYDMIPAVGMVRIMEDELNKRANATGE